MIKMRTRKGAEKGGARRGRRLELGAIQLDPYLARRYRRGLIWRTIFFLATTWAMLVLVLFLLNVVNGAFGLTLVQDTIPRQSLAVDGRPVDELASPQLVAILEERLSRGLLRRFESEQPLLERSQTDLYRLTEEWVIRPQIVESWTLSQTLFRRQEIEMRFSDYRSESQAALRLQFRSWLNPQFLTRPQSPDANRTGVRPALFGSLWMMLLTMLFAFPLGIAAAIYLEEYASDTHFTRAVQVIVYNLSGVPSIIYGLLGLAIFVRFLAPLTSGSLFGLAPAAGATGRTIISAGATLSLLVLPLIIINTQEAVRAVPRSLRDASFGLGATRWQTIWHHVLPASFDRILTGAILAISRAVGETAPLIVVGASTFITTDPTGPFARFTTLPIQIYQWSARPQPEFRNAAAAAIILLLVLLLSTNTVAIVLRNRLSRRKRQML